MPTKKSPVSSPISHSSQSRLLDSLSRVSSEPSLDDEGDILSDSNKSFIYSDDEERSRIISLASSDSEIVTPKRRTKKNSIKLSSSSESEVKTPKTKKKIVIASSSESDDKPPPKTKPKTKPKKKIVIANSSESDSEDKKHSPSSKKKIVIASSSESDSDYKKHNTILKVTRDDNEKEPMYKSRVLIANIVNKTLIEGEDGSLNKAEGEAAILLGRQINNKFWLDSTYDEKLEALIQKYIETAPELDAFYPVKEIHNVPAVIMRLPTQSEKDQITSENSAVELAEAQRNYEQARKEGD